MDGKSGAEDLITKALGDSTLLQSLGAAAKPDDGGGEEAGGEEAGGDAPAAE
jgi:hypothetical protein